MQSEMAEQGGLKETFGKGLLVLLLIGVMVMPLIGAASPAEKEQYAVTLLNAEVAGHSQRPGLSSPALLKGQSVTLEATSRDMLLLAQSSRQGAVDYRSKTVPSVYRAPAAPKPLTNGVTVTGILNATNESDIWYLDVSSGARDMRCVLTCPYEAVRYTDFDLYGKRGSFPSDTSYDWSAQKPGSDEANIGNPGDGRWYILVFSWCGKGTYQLTVTILYTRSVKPLTIGTPVTGSLDATADSDLWYIDVENWTASMRALLTCPLGVDFDLYGMWGSYPTTSNYSWRGCSGGGEDVSFSGPSEGRWYIMPFSYWGNGTYQLTITIGYLPIFSNTVYAIILIGIGGTAIVVLLVVVYRRRFARHSMSGQTIRRVTISGTETVAEPGREREEVSAGQSMKCAKCGALLEAGAGNCWNCGTSAEAVLGTSAETGRQAGQRMRPGICVVCKRALERSDEMLFCPYCGSLAHRDHLLEWLHVKNYCPACGRHLDEGEVQKQI